VELAVGDVERDDVRGAALQQAVRETANPSSAFASFVPPRDT
jgi:hypothetical protein